MFYPQKRNTINNRQPIPDYFFNNLENAIATAATGNRILKITQPYEVISSSEIACDLLVEGGKLYIPSGVTLTIKGKFHAPRTQVFFGDGKVIFSNGSVDEIFPQWFGIKNDGTTSDLKAIQKAIDSAYESGVPVVNIAGLNNIAVNGAIEMKPGVKLYGGTRTRNGTYVGKSTKIKAISSVDYVIKLYDIEEPAIEGLHIDGNGYANVGIYLDGCKRALTRDVYIGGCNNTQIHLYASKGTYYNYFERVKCNGGDYGVKIETPTTAPEANVNTFVMLDLWGPARTGTYGIYLNYANATTFIHPIIQNYDYAFFLDQHVRTFAVYGGYVEGSLTATFKMDGQTSAGGPLFIIGLRSADPTEFEWVGGSPLSGFGLGKSVIATLASGYYHGGEFSPQKFEMIYGATDPLRIRNLPIYEVQGISATSTLCKNMGGTHIIRAGTTYVDVPLANEEPDTGYKVIVTPLNNPGGYIWVSNRTTTGFRINVSAAPASDLYVMWFIFRGAQ